jgi:hypothetical protein
MSHNVRNGTEPSRATRSIAAGTLTLYHSRYLAKTLGHKASPRCAADKLAIWLTPAWLYLPMVRATGELAEYMAHARHRVKRNEALSADGRRLGTPSVTGIAACRSTAAAGRSTLTAGGTPGPRRRASAPASTRSECGGEQSEVSALVDRPAWKSMPQEERRRRRAPARWACRALPRDRPAARRQCREPSH